MTLNSASFSILTLVRLIPWQTKNMVGKHFSWHRMFPTAFINKSSSFLYGTVLGLEHHQIRLEQTRFSNDKYWNNDLFTPNKKNIPRRTIKPSVHQYEPKSYKEIINFYTNTPYFDSTCNYFPLPCCLLENKCNIRVYNYIFTLSTTILQKLETTNFCLLYILQFTAFPMWLHTFYLFFHRNRFEIIKNLFIISCRGDTKVFL